MQKWKKLSAESQVLLGTSLSRARTETLSWGALGACNISRLEKSQEHPLVPRRTLVLRRRLEDYASHLARDANVIAVVAAPESFRFMALIPPRPAFDLNIGPVDQLEEVVLCGMMGISPPYVAHWRGRSIRFTLDITEIDQPGVNPQDPKQSVQRLLEECGRFLLERSTSLQGGQTRGTILVGNQIMKDKFEEARGLLGARLSNDGKMELARVIVPVVIEVALNVSQIRLLYSDQILVENRCELLAAVYIPCRRENGSTSFRFEVSYVLLLFVRLSSVLLFHVFDSTYDPSI